MIELVIIGFFGLIFLFNFMKYQPIYAFYTFIFLVGYFFG